MVKAASDAYLRPELGRSKAHAGMALDNTVSPSSCRCQCISLLSSRPLVIFLTPSDPGDPAH